MPSTALALSDADRAIVTSPAAKQLRAKLALFVAGSLASQAKLLRGKVPSYVADAADVLIAAVDRWERDEQSCE